MNDRMKNRLTVLCEKWKRPEEGNLFRQYRRTYLGMLLIAAGVMTVLMIFLLRLSMKEKEIRLRQDAVVHFAGDLQNQISIFDEIHNAVLTSSYYQPNRIFLNKYYEIAATEDLTRYALFSPIIDYLFLYYKGDELCFTSTGYKTSFDVFFSKKLGISDSSEQAELEMLLNSFGVGTLVRLSDYGAEGGLLFLHPVRFHGAEENRCEAVMGFIVSEQNMASRMQSLFGYSFDNLTIYIDGKCCFGSIDADRIPEEMRPVPGSSGRIIHEQNQLLCASSENGSIQVYVSGNWDPFLQEVAQNIGFILLGVALISFAFLFFAIFLARRHAQPISRLATTYGIHAGKNALDELGEIENALKIHVHNSEVLAHNAKEQLLMMILQGKSDSYMLRRWENYGISFPYANNIVYVVTVPRKSVEKQESLTAEIESFATRDAHIYAILLQEKARIVVLCSFLYRNEQEKMYENLLALTSEDVNEGNVYVGNSCEQAEKLSVSYQEALTTLHSDNEAFRNASSVHTRITELLIRIRHSVDEESVESIQYYLKQIGEIFIHEETYAPIQRYVCSSLLSVLSLLYYENQLEIDRQKFSNLMVEQDFTVFSEQYCTMLSSIFTHHDTKEETTPEKILGYIEEHISDCDFCLDELSCAFNLNVDYISRLIKGMAGVGFKEYLTRLRIDKAKEMLIERKDLGVSEIGALVGYRTPSNFIKKFRDEMGMTPLQFRNNAAAYQAGQQM